jgi:tRNA (guanine-N7-)-methyltransferase
MTVAQARALRELLERYRIPLATEPIDWSAQFGRAAPLALEIGFGMGHALLETAQRHPEWNCLGVEVYRPGIGALLNAVEAAGLPNVRVIEGDARVVLANMMTEETLHRVMVFFPDPWPKSKHHKRRLDQRRICRAGCTEARCRRRVTGRHGLGALCGRDAGGARSRAWTAERRG